MAGSRCCVPRKEEAMPEIKLSAGTVEYEDTGGDGSLWRNVVADKGREPFGMVRMDTPGRRFAREGSL